MKNSGAKRSKSNFKAVIGLVLLLCMSFIALSMASNTEAANELSATVMGIVC